MQGHVTAMMALIQRAASGVQRCAARDADYNSPRVGLITLGFWSAVESGRRQIAISRDALYLSLTVPSSLAYKPDHLDMSFVGTAAASSLL